MKLVAYLSSKLTEQLYMLSYRILFFGKGEVCRSNTFYLMTVYTEIIKYTPEKRY